MPIQTFHNRFPRSPLALAVGLLVLAPLGLAQDARLSPIQIQTDPPIGASRVDTDTLRLLRPATSDTASLLRDIPGVSLYGAGGVSSLPSIRGLADDRLRIKVDGMDLIASCPNHMNPPLSYLDPSQVGAIKVFAGIAPVSLGGDSIGGTIAVDTLEPVFAAPGEGLLRKGEIGVFYRSNNAAVGGNLTATQAGERFSIQYSGSHSQADNYTAARGFKEMRETGRQGHSLPRKEVGSTAYETQNHQLGLAMKAGDDLLEVELGYQRMPEQLYPNQRMDLLDNTQKRANLRWSGAFDWGSLEARAYHERVDHFMDFGDDKRFWYGMASGGPGAASGMPCSPLGSTCATGMPMYSESRTNGLSLHADIDLVAGDVLRVGVEHQRYRLDDYWTASGAGMWPGTFLNVDDGRRDRSAVFAEWETQFDKQWLGLLGVRYERVVSDAADVRGYSTDPAAMGNQVAESAAFNAVDRKQTDNNIDLTALARYTHDANLDVEFGVARKLRSPNLYERYTWSSWPMAASMNNFVGDGNGYVGKVDLRPEKAYTLSATIDWHAADRSWELKATPYYTRVSDYIDAVPFGTQTVDRFNVLQYANQSARIYGIDLSGKLPLASNAWGDWGLAGLLSYTNGKNRDTGDHLYNIMPLNAKLTLSQKSGGWSNGIELVVVDGKDKVSAVRNEIETSSYTLVNLRASHSWKKLRLDFGVENLFDEFYSLPTGGAYLGQGTTMSMNGIPWGIAVPGMGRSLYAGINLSF